MATRIGEAVLDVRAGTAKLRHDLSQAEGAVARSARRMRDDATEGGRGFDAAGGRVVHFRERVDKLEQPISSMRGLMDELGVSASNSTGKVAVFGQELLSTFADGGPLFLGLAAIGVGVAYVVNELEEAAQAAAKIEFLHLDEERIERLAREFDDLGHASVVALTAAGKEAGLTEEEIVRLGRTARREAEMSGKSFDESLTAAIKRMGLTASQVRREMNAFLASEFARQAGDVAPFDDQEFNRLLQRQADLEAELQENRRRREEIYRTPIEGRFRFRDEERALESEAESLRREIAEVREVLDAMLDAREETQRVLEEEFDTTPVGSSVTLARAGERLEEQAEQLAKSVRQRLARMLAEGNPLETLNVKLREELDRIAEQMAEAEAILNDPQANEAARQRAREAIEALQRQDEAARRNYLLELDRREVEATRRHMKETGKALADSMRTAAPRAIRDSRVDQMAAEAGAIAGIRFGEQFVLGFRRMAEGDGGVASVLGTVLGLGGAFASLFPGGQVAGTAMMAAGNVIGSFADGGAVAGPGGPRSDNLLAWVSPGEFIVNADATRLARPLLEALNDGRFAGLQAFASGGTVGGAAGVGAAAVYVDQRRVEIAAFDPRSMYEAAGVSLAPALYRRSANRSDPKLTSQQRRALATPRMGRVAR